MISFLPNSEFINLLVNSGMWITFVCSILAVLCYGGFSRFYEPLTRSTENSLLTAALLYGGAAFLLTISVLLCILLFGWHFMLPAIVKVFNFTLGFTDVASVLLLLILIMSLLYFSHIATEAVARRSMNMGVYTLLFQINVVVIAFMDWTVYPKPLSAYMLLGGIFIFLSSALALAAHNFIAKNGRVAVKISSGIILLGIVSAVSCGLALYIDGEIGRNYIFKGDFDTGSLAAFLLYEMLTFFIPFLWAFFTLSLSKAPWHVGYQLIKEFMRNKKGYLLSSLFSAGQFVFSVLALSLPGSRIIVAIILALNPMLPIFLDRNKAPKRIKILEYVCGGVSAIGLFLLILVANHQL